MADPNLITVRARLTGDPEIKTTATGTTLAKVSLASSGRLQDPQTGQWQDGPAVFWNCTAWRQTASNIAQSLHKGDAVIALLRAQMVEYDSKDGTHNRTIQWTIETIGLDLKYATAAVTRNPPRSQAPAMPHAHAPAMPQATPQADEYDPWANPTAEPEF